MRNENNLPACYLFLFVVVIFNFLICNHVFFGVTSGGRFYFKVSVRVTCLGLQRFFLLYVLVPVLYEYVSEQ